MNDFDIEPPWWFVGLTVAVLVLVVCGVCIVVEAWGVFS